MICDKPNFLSMWKHLITMNKHILHICSMESNFCRTLTGIISVLFFLLLSSGLVSGNITLKKFACFKNAKQESVFLQFQTGLFQRCCRLCANVSDCNAVNYNDESGMCQLSQSTEQNGSIYPASGWNVCYKTNEVITDCIGRSCFIAVTNKTSWERANSNCLHSYGGHLANVKSAPVQNLLHRLFPYRGSRDKVWLGGTADVTLGVFKWTDGGLVSNGFQNWGQGQPSGGDENCLGVRVFDNYRWNDAPCTELYMSICEFPAGS